MYNKRELRHRLEAIIVIYIYYMIGDVFLVDETNNYCRLTIDKYACKLVLQLT